MNKMPRELIKQMENHLATFPERHEDLLEMKKEWRELKTKMTWVLVGFFGSMLSIGVWVGTMQSSIANIAHEHDKIETITSQSSQRIGVLEVNNSEVRTRLGSIEVTLQEIKAAIIKLQ